MKRLTTPPFLNLAAAHVSPLTLPGRKIRADSPRLLRFSSSTRESCHWRSLSLTAALLFVLGVFTGCESTDGGGSARVSGGVYYGAGFYDPWYYGYWDDPDYIVTPPPPGDRPPSEIGAHPEHPIAKPPPSAPAPRPTPSIPSTPRPMARPAMRR